MQLSEIKRAIALRLMPVTASCFPPPAVPVLLLPNRSRGGGSPIVPFHCQLREPPSSVYSSGEVETGIHPQTYAVDIEARPGRASAENGDRHGDQEQQQQQQLAGAASPPVERHVQSS
ncbi:hypothetical protein ZWY2020_045043 [Hordeum vulgare]|nr:hypothetical protein ZWY2020_045043 [Hordeum vulgare]